MRKIYKDGSLQEGQFENGKADGYKRFISQFGEMQVAGYKQDKFHGPFKWYTADGELQEDVVFENGRVKE